MGAAWAGYYADRALLLLTVPWLLMRLLDARLWSQRPAVLYEPVSWLGQLVFPSSPSLVVWGGLVGLTAVAAAVCFWKPRLLAARLVLVACVLLVITPEYTWSINHANHLFLLAHLYALFLPIERPTVASAPWQARALRWYQTGILIPYTMAGLWKFVDMTIRRVLKPGMTWLDPDAMLIVSTATYRSMDLPLDIPRLLEPVRFLMPVGYVVIAVVFAAAVVAAWRRPLVALVLPTILLFHLSNSILLSVHFVPAMIVALVVLLPYDHLVPALRRRYAPVDGHMRGHGADARYRRRYADGTTEIFEGFFAYRARLADRSWLLAAPLYYPGVGWLGRRLLGRSAHEENA